MDQPPGGGAPPQFSPDHQWWWNGTEWVPASQAPSQPPASDSVQSSASPSAAPAPVPPTPKLPKGPGFWSKWPTWVTVVLGILFWPVTGFIFIYRRAWSDKTKWSAAAAWAVVVLVALIIGSTASTTTPSSNVASNNSGRDASSPTPPAVVPADLVSERLDVAENELDQDGIKYTEVGGGSLGIVVKSNWVVCDTRPKAGATVTGSVALIVDHFSCSGSTTTSSGSGGTPAAASPSPQAAPPAPAPPAQPAAIRFSGTGQGTPHFTVTQGLAIIAASCNCSGNFAVELLDSSGNSKDIPINTIGSYSGSVGEGLDAGGYILNITADGPWNITITQPRGVTGANLPVTYSKHGQWIVGPFATDNSAVSIKAQNTGSGNFAVEVLDQDGQSQDIPINEIGNYSGSVISNDLSNGPYYLNVTSDGNWTITVSTP